MARTATLPSPPQPEGAANGALERAADGVAAHALRRGGKLGDYRLLAPVAAGGMAYVWAAARSGDYGFQRLFAIKAMREEIAFDASFRRMFLEEAKLAARIHHTNVVDVIDLGEEAGVVYQVMPLVEGDSLAGLVRAMQEREPDANVTPKVPRSVAVRVIVDALRGLHAAHETRGEGGAPLDIVHRDVSPQNILVGVDGIAKIADFGVAKALGSLGDETEAGTIKGKVSYMAPEQLRKAKIDRRCDVFSTGVVLWELLVGTRLAPAAASTLLASEVIDDPSARDASVPAPIAAIAMRALAAAPDARFATADAMADALEAAAAACGLSLSSKDVASWASALATPRLARRREDVAEAVATERELEGKTRIEAVPRRRRAGAIVVAAAIAMGIAMGAWGMTRGARGTVATSVAPAIAAPVAASPTASATPVASSAPSAAPPAAIDSAPPRVAPAARGRRPRDVPPARPKFGNPYAP